MYHKTIIYECKNINSSFFNIIFDAWLQMKGMSAKLLQKVEELTLYVIDLQKQIEELKQQQK